MAVVTKTLQDVVESTPSIVQSTSNPSLVSQKVPAIGVVSDFINSLPFYTLNLFFFIYLLVLWTLMIRWVGRDCERRGVPNSRKRNYQVLALIFNFPGLLLYLMSRPSLTLEEIRRSEMEEEILTLELEKLRRESASAAGGKS